MYLLSRGLVEYICKKHLYAGTKSAALFQLLQYYHSHFTIQTKSLRKTKKE